MLQKYVWAIDTFAKGDLIDLGCGNAPLVGVYRDRVRSFLLADWENSLHKEVAKDVVIDLNGDLDLPTDRFDTIILSDVLEHIECPDHLLGEMFRILRPGGCAIVGVPFLYWLHEGPRDYMRYTRFKLERMGKDVGFHIHTLVETGGGWDVAYDVSMKILFAHRNGVIGRSAHAFYSSIRPLLKRSIAKWEKRIPLGYLVVYEKPR